MPRFRVPLGLGATVLGLCAMTVAARAASPAEMRVDAPAETQIVGAPFEVRVSITRAEAMWGGYNDQIVYDPKVLKVNSVRPGGIADCKEPNSWAHQQPQPPEPGLIGAGCAFQSTTETGVTEIIEFECIKDGGSALHLVTTSENPANPSYLFNEDAVPIPTDLVDGSVSCGAGGPIETIAAPTPPVAPSSVPPGGSTPDASGTPGVSSSAPAGGTPGAGVTSGTGGGTVVPGTTAAAGPAATRAAATNTATASKTASAEGSTQTSDDGSGPTWWLIAVIIVVVLGAGGGAGWYVLRRRRGAGGG